jgi:outer membrane lipoprotein SlyB
MGSSGAAGATGSASGSSQSYRVTVRMDDGSTQVVTHGTTPDFRSGDRVNVTGGSIQR